MHDPNAAKSLPAATTGETPVPRGEVTTGGDHGRDARATRRSHYRVATMGETPVPRGEVTTGWRPWARRPCHDLKPDGLSQMLGEEFAEFARFVARIDGLCHSGAFQSLGVYFRAG